MYIIIKCHSTCCQLFLCEHPYLPLPAWHHRILCPRWMQDCEQFRCPYPNFPFPLSYHSTLLCFLHWPLCMYSCQNVQCFSLSLPTSSSVPSQDTVPSSDWTACMCRCQNVCCFSVFILTHHFQSGTIV